MFTLKDSEEANASGIVIPSFASLYLELADPTEYRPAKELLGGWEHWRALCSSEWFTRFIQPLRDELEVKLRSEAIVATYKIMKRQGQTALPAAKFFTDNMAQPSTDAKRTLDEAKKLQKQAAEEALERLENDAERLNLMN